MTLKIYLNQLIEYYIKTKKYIQNSKTILQDLKNKYSIIYKEYIMMKDISVKAKAKAIIFKHCPNLIYNLKKININIQSRKILLKPKDNFKYKREGVR